MAVKEHRQVRLAVVSTVLLTVVTKLLIQQTDISEQNGFNYINVPCFSPQIMPQ